MTCLLCLLQRARGLYDTKGLSRSCARTAGAATDNPSRRWCLIRSRAGYYPVESSSDMSSFTLPRTVLALAALCVAVGGCAATEPQRQAGGTHAAILRAGGSPTTALSPAVPAGEPPEY